MVQRQDCIRMTSVKSCAQLHICHWWMLPHQNIITFSACAVTSVAFSHLLIELLLSSTKNVTIPFIVGWLLTNQFCHEDKHQKDDIQSSPCGVDKMEFYTEARGDMCSVFLYDFSSLHSLMGHQQRTKLRNKMTETSPKYCCQFPSMNSWVYLQYDLRKTYCMAAIMQLLLSAGHSSLGWCMAKDHTMGSGYLIGLTKSKVWMRIYS